MREKTFYPRLALIQAADRECAWVIDPLAFSREEMQPLLDVFASPDTLKAAHAVEQDQECLYRAYGMTAEPVLDTAVAAALTGRRGDQIGLSALLHKLLAVRLTKGHTRANWMKRPLPEAMIEYAAATCPSGGSGGVVGGRPAAFEPLGLALALSAGFGEAARHGIRCRRAVAETSRAQPHGRGELCGAQGTGRLARTARSFKETSPKLAGR